MIFELLNHMPAQINLGIAAVAAVKYSLFYWRGILALDKKNIYPHQPLYQKRCFFNKTGLVALLCVIRLRKAMLEA
jgi:hypothetical protein